MIPNDFPTILERAVRRAGSQVALAKALGVDPTRISRLIRGGGDYARLNFENCLRLAQILDEWPIEILKAAGHTEQARLFEQLCGPSRDERSVRAGEWELLQKWRALPAAQKSAILTLIRPEEEPAAPAASVRREFPRRVGRRNG